MTVKRSVIASLFGLIVIGCVWIFAGISPKQTSEIQECDNVFSSSVYIEYQNQLTSFLKEELLLNPSLEQLPGMTGFIDFLLHPETNLRNYHSSWVKDFRKQISNSGNSEPVKTFLKRLDRWLITGPYLEKPMEEFLFTRFSLPEYNENYANVVFDYHKTISKEKSFYTSFGTPAYDDGFLYGNLPSYLFSLNNPKETKVLRMANPAKDLLLTQSFFMQPKDKIQEEFYHYIDSLGQEKHLYINLMKRKGKESRKTQQLENFEETQDSLILISLDKDSDFYWQIRSYATLNDATRFKTLFHQNLMKKGGNYYWSNKLHRDDWSKECKEILEKTHQKYFASNPTLSKEERCNFIELSYIGIINRLVDKFEPAYLNISCRHSMDRGPSLTTLLYVDNALKQGEELSSDHSQILTMLFSPPLLIHNRRSHTSRIRRFASAVEHLQKSLHVAIVP